MTSEQNRPRRNLGLALKWILWRSGWRAENRQPVPWKELPDYSGYPVVRSIVEDFFDLKISGNGMLRGGGCCDVNIDPRLVADIGSELLRLDGLNGNKLFPIGETHQGRGVLLVDASGALYWWGESNKLLPLGMSFEKGLKRLLVAPLHHK
jgi:hypothetical protein